MHTHIQPKIQGHFFLFHSTSHNLTNILLALLLPFFLKTITQEWKSLKVKILFNFAQLYPYIPEQCMV